MTQKIFDTDNAEDMALLWSILPDDAVRISLISGDIIHIEFEDDETNSRLYKINWHDKTEITRPIQEATKADIGKICKFWNDKEYSDDVCFGILNDIREDISCGKVYLRNKEMWCGHARRLTKQEIEEIC